MKGDLNIKKFYNKHEGKRCYILGNGPSLGDVDLGALRKEITFGTNRIYLADGFEPSYYVCVNDLVLKQFGGEIMGLGSVKFLPNWFLDVVEDETKEKGRKRGAWRAVGLDTSLRVPAFSNPEGAIWEGHTVTYVCLQLAFYMGFQEVILLGVDHDYGEKGRGRPNLEVVGTGADEYHFHPDYFGPDKRWHKPHVETMQMCLQYADEYLRERGVNVYNATMGGKLECIPRADYNQVLAS